MNQDKQNLITASVCPFPFRSANRQVAIPAGSSVLEAMGQLAPMGVLYHAHVFIDGEPVSRDDWSVTYLRSGQQMDVRVVPTGGGGDGEGGTSDKVNQLLTPDNAIYVNMMNKTWRGVASALTGLGGWYMMYSMLYPPVIPEPDKDDPLYSITGQQNRANRYGAIPKIYGKMRVYPPLAALPYTEVAGEDQYLRILYTPGYGPLKLSEFMIGDESAENYDAEISYCEGHASCTDCDQYTAGQTTCDAGWTTDGTPVGSDIYSDTIYEKQLSDELVYEAGAGWHMHETQADADVDRISIDVTFPEGLCNFNDDGDRTSATNNIEMRYMKKSLYDASGTDWLPSTDPTVEELCPDFDEWTAEGGATYSADIDGGGNPGFTLDADGEYAHSPVIKVSYPSEFDFLADYYSDVASPEYTVECTYFRSAYTAMQDKYATRNDDGETTTVIDGVFNQSAWDEETEKFTGGGGVRYVRFKIKYNADSPGLYKFRLPRIVTYKQWEIRESRTRAFRKTFHWDVADPAEYVVQVRRSDSNSGADRRGDMYWTTLRTIVWDNPISYSGTLAQVAMSVKASDVATGTLDRFSVLASSILPVYSGGWTPTETASPAWAFCDALRSEANANAVDASRIDLTKMALWAAHAANKPFNGIIDKQMSLYEVIKAIASVGRASPTLLDGQYSVVEDISTTTIVQHFTPRNSWGFSGSKSFVEIPHGLKLKFFNEHEDYVQDEVIYYHPDYTADTATKFQTYTLMGITDSDQAYTEGRYHMAAMILRPEMFVLQVDVEHIVCTRGDRVKVTHDVPLIGLGFGRLTSATNIGGDIYELGLDSEVTMVTGNNYALRLRLADGTTVAFDIVNENDTVSTVTMTGPWFGAPTPAVGDLFQFGIKGAESLDMLVHSIVPGADLSATLTLVEYNSSVYDGGDIPEHESNISVPPEIHRTPPVPIIESVASDENAMYEIAPGVYESQILITLQRVSSAKIMPHDIHVQYRETDSEAQWQRLPAQPAGAASVSVRPVEDGISYDVRLRYVSEYGRASAWKYENAHEVIGKSTVPDDITTMVYQPSGRLEWEYTPPRDFLGFKVRYNSGSNVVWSDGTPAHGGHLTVTNFDISGFAAGTMTWLVKAFDTAGNESAGAAYVIKDIGDPVTENIVQTIDYDADGYPGSLDDCTVDAGDLKADEETSLFYHGDATLFYDRGTLFYGSTYKAMTYEMSFYPYVDTTVGSDLWLDYTATGIDDIYYRTSETVESEDFSGDLSAWTEDNDGTWVIAGNALTAIHDAAGVWNQTLSWDDWTGTVGDKYYYFMRVKSADVSDVKFGVQLRGQYYLWTQTKHTKSAEGDTTDNPVMTDDTWAAWLFEVLADGTINWYVDGSLIDSGTAQGTSALRLILQPDAAGPTTTYFDDIQVWEPSADWMIWPGKIRTDDDELYEIRFRSLAGGTRGVISTLSTKLDVEDVTEYHNDFACAVTTGTRLTLIKTYTDLQNVSVTVQTSGAETAITAKADDKQNTAGANNGPLIKCYNAAGAVVAGHVDVTIKGF